MTTIVFFFVISSLLDVLGIGLIAPYISIVLGQEIIDFNFLINFAFVTEQNKMLVISLSLVLIFFLKFIISVFIHKKIVEFSQINQSKIAVRLMKSYQSYKYEDFILRNSSSFVYNIQTLTVQFSQTILSVLKVVGDIFIVLAIILLLGIKDIFALTILVLIVGGSAILYDLFLKAKITRYGKLSNEFSTKMIKSINEGFHSFKEIRVFAKESFFSESLKQGSLGHAINHTKSQFLSIIPRYGVEFLIILFIASFSMFTYYFLDNISQIYTTIAMFGVASLRLVPAVNSILNSILQIRYGKDGMYRIYNDLKDISTKKTEDVSIIREFKNLELKNISYNYPRSNKDIFREFSIKINNGDFIGIAGKSGCGKTTLIDLLLGLLVPKTGKIILNGKEANPSILHSIVAYIPQDPVIIDASLRENISFSRNKENDNKIIQSIEKAALTKILSALDDGLDSPLGERGVSLSGGQKQRIALARSFFFDRKIIILDESTSALDEETEQKIINEINKLKGLKTFIVVSHSKSTLKACDKVYDLSSEKYKMDS